MDKSITKNVDIFVRQIKSIDMSALKNVNTDSAFFKIIIGVLLVLISIMIFKAGIVSGEFLKTLTQ